MNVKNLCRKIPQIHLIRTAQIHCECHFIVNIAAILTHVVVDVKDELRSRLKDLM